MTKVSINEINENRAYPNSNDSTNGNCEVTHEQNPPLPREIHSINIFLPVRKRIGAYFCYVITYTLQYFLSSYQNINYYVVLFMKILCIVLRWVNIILIPLL